jgi:hypothetical protein
MKLDEVVVFGVGLEADKVVITTPPVTRITEATCVNLYLRKRQLTIHAKESLTDLLLSL